ncbi:glycosyl hydrolase family 8 [Clostridium sp. CTA-5]
MKKYSNEELTLELLSFYHKWKKLYLRTVKNSSPTKEYLFDTLEAPTENNAVTSSTAMGYGMIIFSIMSNFDTTAKEHFNNIYNFIKAYPSIYNDNLMAWQQIIANNGDIINTNPKTASATNGDIDICYGLLIANKLWRKEDKIEYKKEALKRINALMDSCVDKEDYILNLGDWVNTNVNSKFKGITRSSDFSVYILKEFVKVDLTNSNAWRNVIKRINNIINNQMNRESKKNGLMPDFFIKDKNQFIAPKEKILETIHDGDYYYNSCKTPWRYSMDILLNNTPITNQLSTLNNWIITKTNSNPKNIVSGYYVAQSTPGEAFGVPNDLSFIAPFLVSSLIQNKNEIWTIELWKILIDTPIENSLFYGNTLKLIAMIVATGNWVVPERNF